MRGGDAGDEDEEAAGVPGPPVSPYSRPQVPDRRSVIPPSQETFTFPSGRVARPVEEYLVPETPLAKSGETSEAEAVDQNSMAESTGWTIWKDVDSDSNVGGPKG